MSVPTSGHLPRLPLFFLLGALILIIAAGCGTREGQNVAFDMDIVDGQLVGESLLSVNQNDTVTINWNSDTPILVHLHGYNIELALPSSVTEPMTFDADATGRFNITIHSTDAVHVHGSGEACRVSVPAGEPQPRVQIHATESRMRGNVVIEVDVENFEIAQGAGHWHLTMDGVDYGMYSRQAVTLAVEGTGERVFEATLADAHHCLYDASDSTTVMIAGPASETDAALNATENTPMPHEGAHTHGTPMPDDSMDMANDGSGDAAAGIPERVIAVLEVRP